MTSGPNTKDINIIQESTSKWIPGRYPPIGTSPIADAIRKRRGERGITELDAALLHAPPIAEGWNSLLGAVRTKGEVGGDLRELMILRVAAINGAKYEWVHHETVGRKEGLNTAQLYIIRDTKAPLPPPSGILSPIQSAALVFADHSTRTVKVTEEVTLTLRARIKSELVDQSGKELMEDEVKNKVDDLFVEMSLIVATYNMVSRFLVTVDVAGFSGDEVPWPVNREEHFVPIPNTDLSTHKIHTITLKSSPSSPWIVFSNSLLTDYSLWSLVIPYFLEQNYNLILHSQRGHGQSNFPSSPTSDEGDKRVVTIPSLASDIFSILKYLQIPTPIHAVIGVSQGGATALSYAALYGTFGAKNIVACDTGPKTPAGNKEAWEERIRLVRHSGDRECGMRKLADVTVPRWFPSGSKVSSQMDGKDTERAEWVKKLITGTTVEGFENGARALSDYDTISSGILGSDIESVLLLAGQLDGNGKVAEGLSRLQTDWNAQRGKEKKVEFIVVKRSGHLPMVDEPEMFWKVVQDFLGRE